MGPTPVMKKGNGQRRSLQDARDAPSEVRPLIYDEV
jgi:hypothetical protein